jgi:hypothetical protein
MRRMQLREIVNNDVVRKRGCPDKLLVRFVFEEVVLLQRHLRRILAFVLVKRCAESDVRKAGIKISLLNGDMFFVVIFLRLHSRKCTE